MFFKKFFILSENVWFAYPFYFLYIQVHIKFSKVKRGLGCDKFKKPCPKIVKFIFKVGWNGFLESWEFQLKHRTFQLYKMSEFRRSHSTMAVDSNTDLSSQKNLRG